MKIKHMQGEGRNIAGNGGPDCKRGRGRPRKLCGLDPTQNSMNTGSRLDPTGDMFLKGEEKKGGPSDPVLHFEESVGTLFPGVY